MERIKKSLILIVLMSSVLFSHPVYAVSGEATVQIEAKLQQVALFKNGLGFFVLEVTVPRKEKVFSIVPFGAASHGTFWVSYPPKVKLESLTAKEVELEKSIEAISVEELLRANVGRKVQLSFDDKGEATIKGIIRSFAENRSEPQPSPYAPGREGYRDAPRYIRPPVRASLIIVETDAGEVAIDSQRVRRVEFLNGKAEKTFKDKTKSMQLEVKLAEPAGGKKLTVSYLAKGITWAPSYIVDIGNDDKALISAKAAVINEVCDLDDVTIQLVTGFPNLQFADVVSPLALKENLAQFLQSLVRGQSERGKLRGVMTQLAFKRADDYIGGRRGEAAEPHGRCGPRPRLQH